MKSTRKTEEVKVKTKRSSQDDVTGSAKSDEKLKKNIYSISTPRNYVPKSSAADIYARRKPAAQRKTANASISNESPMKDLLKSTPSSSRVSSTSSRQKMTEQKANANLHSASKSTPRRQTPSNITVNSPVAKRRLNLEVATDSSVKNGNSRKAVTSSRNQPKDPPAGRQRTKTRTLEEDEVKVLTPEALDNNAAMQHLSRKLTAKPKAFYIELDEKPKVENTKHNTAHKSSEEDEVSYEDDFESYESDFESYHSEAKSERTSLESDRNSGEEEDAQVDKFEEYHKADRMDGPAGREAEACDEANSKEVKDEENMLDSGNFELRDPQRSASRKPAKMDFILETSEDQTEDKKVSLPDEGFQEMSSSSAVSSMKVVHTDVLDRPLFIDFTKSKENKRKRKMFEQLKQRANDILSMVTLHEMSYSLFEMAPIPYDLYMATFGRKNYTQTAAQTFDDGITQEVQTDYISLENKWTQFPVEFSKNVIVINEKYDENNDKKDEALSKFDFLIHQDLHDPNIEVSEEYKSNPLKIFLEQKEGAGNDKMLDEEIYKVKLKNHDFNVNRLRKFLKKSESRISNILSVNAGSNETLNLFKKSQLPFSKGYLSISVKNITDEKLSFLKYTKTIGVAISETKENLIMTYQNQPTGSESPDKCFICLWDTSVVRSEPLKILKATDSVAIGRYRGNTNGIFVAALVDRTIHAWDLSEEPTWCNDVASLQDEHSTKLVDINTSGMSQIEVDREWNLRNSQVGYEEKFQSMMRISGYTSSAVAMTSNDTVDNIVGLEFVGEQRETSHDGGRKIIGQICTLQRSGIIVTWSIIQEKNTDTHDIGKAFWSKIKLEKHQTVNLTEHVHVPMSDTDNSFNLNAAKRRLLNRKQERIERRKDLSRPRSAILRNFDRSSSVASPRKNLLNSSNSVGWDSGLVCNHLKVLRLDKLDNYLVASGNGEVYCCKRSLRDFKVDRLRVANDKSPVTRLEVSPNLPYYLAATDSGTVNLCSVVDVRVLLTLDCRNGPPVTVPRCQADHKGRFIATVPHRAPTDPDAGSRFNCNWSVRRVWWSPRGPCRVAAALRPGALLCWELARGDVAAAGALPAAAADLAAAADTLALLTTEGEVQVHRIISEEADKSSMELFKKYVSLL